MTVPVLSSHNYRSAVEQLGRPIASVRDLADLTILFGWHNGEHQLWIHRSVHAMLGIPTDLPPGTGHEGLRGHRFLGTASAPIRHEPDGLAPFMRVVPTDTRYPKVSLCFAAWDHAAGLEDATPGELQGAITLYTDLLNTHYSWSPGSTGVGLMLKGRRQLLGPSTLHPPEPMTWPGTERDLSWWRGLFAREWEKPGYIHVYDAGARYLASCSALELGRGEPRKGQAFLSAPLPGYYLVDLKTHNMPGPDPLDAPGGGGTWMMHPTLELANQLDRIITVLDCYTWTDHGRHLEPWARRIREARRAPSGMAGHAEAMTLLKRTYTMAIGSLAGGWREPGDVFYRPDWRHAIIASSRVNLWRRAQRAGLLGHVVGVEVDALYIWSPEPEPYPEAAFGPPGQLGSMGFVATVPATDVSDALMAAEPPWPAFRELVHHG